MRIQSGQSSAIHSPLLPSFHLPPSLSPSPPLSLPCTYRHICREGSVIVFTQPLYARVAYDQPHLPPSLPPSLGLLLLQELKQGGEGQDSMPFVVGGGVGDGEGDGHVFLELLREWRRGGREAGEEEEEEEGG